MSIHGSINETMNLMLEDNNNLIALLSLLESAHLLFRHFAFTQ